MSSGPVQPGSTDRAEPSELAPAADAQAVRAALALERPELRVESLERIGEGVKSVVWRVRADDEDDFALKALKPKFHGYERTEIAFHEALGEGHRELEGVIPRLLFVSRGELPLIASTMLEGEQLLNLRGFDHADCGPIYRRLGEVLAVLHRKELPSFGAMPVGEERSIATNAQYMTERWVNCWNGFRHHGANPYLAARARKFLLEREELWDTGGSPRLCHADAHPGNVLVVRDDDGRVRFSGLLDFESSVATDPAFDLAAACTSLVKDPGERIEAMVEGHGEPEGPWRERVAMYHVMLAMSDWAFYAQYVARSPQRVCERRILEITDSSRVRFWRSQAKRAVTRRRGSGDGG